MTLTDALHPVMASIDSNQVITTSVLVSVFAINLFFPVLRTDVKGVFFSLSRRRRNDFIQLQ